MNKRSITFAIAVAIQVAVIFAIVIFKLSIVEGGTSVLLRIAPVDPTDLFRGDYLTFTYDAATVNGYQMEPGVRNGETVFVPLRQSGQYHYVSGRVGRTLPAVPGTDVVYLKAIVMSGGDDAYGDPTPVCDPFSGIPCAPMLPGGKGQDYRVYRLSFGAEQYFIPEGIGRNFNFFGKEASAQLIVDERGNAVLEQVFIGTVPFEQYVKQQESGR